MIDWSSFASLIERHERFVLTTHVRPDCDGIGSVLALASALRSKGKEATIVVPFTTPPGLEFLIDGVDAPKRIGHDITAEELETYDALIICDTSSWAQLADMADVVRETKLEKIVVDHHAIGDDIGATLFTDSTVEATGRLIVEIFDALEVELNVQTASWLFAAIATDTGWFRFSSVTSETYHVIARLVDVGVRPDDLYRQLYEQDKISRLQLIGLAISRVATELDGRVIHTYLHQADFKKLDSHPSESEDVINMLLTVDGVEAAVILVELSTGGYKLSFRSRCEMDCSQVAAELGGGGHKKAAGAFLDLPFEEAQKKALETVCQRMP